MKFTILLITIFISNFLYSDEMQKETEIYLLKASASLANGNLTLAWENINSALLNSPENKKIKLYTAILYSMQKNYVDSQIILFKTFKKQENLLAEFYKYYNYYFLKEAITKEGKEKLKKIENFLYENRKKLTVDKLIFIASVLYEENQKNKSHEVFKSATEKNPDILSLDYMIVSAKDIVYDIYENLSPPHDYYYYDSFGKLQILLGDNTGAIKTLKKNLEKEKNDILAKKLLSEAYLNLKDYDNSLKYINEIEKFYATEENIYLNLAKIYEAKKENKKVLKICKEGLKLIPLSSGLRYCVARELYKNKNYKEALYNLKYLMEQLPNSYEIMLLTGDVLNELGRVISSEPDPFKRQRMGEDYLQKFPNAAEFYVKAYQLKPGSIEVIERILSFINEYREADENLRNKPIEEIQKDMTKFMSYYEPLVEKQTLENNNIDFYKNFKLYLKTKSDKYFDLMKFLPLGKTFLRYIEYLKNKNFNNFNKFMSVFSKKYLLNLKNNTPLNKFRYKYFIENEKKQIEEVKVFDFIIPSYFD